MAQVLSTLIDSWGRLEARSCKERVSYRLSLDALAVLRGQFGMFKSGPKAGIMKLKDLRIAHWNIHLVDVSQGRVPSSSKLLHATIFVFGN